MVCYIICYLFTSQDDQSTGLGEFTTLSELKSRLSEQGEEAYVDHRDLISQALMERIMMFTDDSMDVSSVDGYPAKQEVDRVDSMEEDGGDVLSTVDGYLMLHDGGSGPPSLGSLTLSSQPTSLSQQPHSLSLSTGMSEEDGGKWGREGGRYRV